jgi:TraX protein
MRCSAAGILAAHDRNHRSTARPDQDRRCDAHARRPHQLRPGRPAGALLAWWFGRIAFPLFCFVLASHIARGMDPRTHVTRLLVFGALTQPIFNAAFPWSPREANILFTLAAGAALAQALAGRPSWVQHLTFASGTLVICWWPALARTGFDFGLAGILFPAALALLLKGEWPHGLWVAVLLVGDRYYIVEGSSRRVVTVIER